MSALVVHTSAFFARPERGTLALSTAIALLFAALPCAALPQPDQLLTAKKLIVKTDTGDSTKNKIIFLSKDNSFALPNASNDPTVAGATLEVLDLGPGATGGSASIALPASRWSAISNGFKYKGQTGDPCKTVVIKGDKLLKIVCKGSGVTLAAPFSGNAGIGLTVGTTAVRYCSTLGGTTIKNELKTNGKGLLKRKEAPAPAACLTCGNGSLDPGEQCDDGNTAGGDCCSAGCKFEAAGAGCSDGSACTTGDVCDGAGTCSGDPLCGNDTVDGACGEQCDGSDDGACPDRCNTDCTCLPDPSCAADPSRTFFAGGPGTGACQQFDDNQLLCEQAFILGDGGVTSCFYDPDSDSCRGCGPTNQAQGLCMNSCRPVTCVGDPSRTEFAGGPEEAACRNFGLIAGTANCDIAFHIGADGVASCFYDSDADQCRGCGATNQYEGKCVNTCAACENDPSRVLFAGGPGTSACHQFDGDETGCRQAFHRDQCGNDVSCYYDGFSCSGCGPNNEADGNCLNTCRNGPVSCTNDPSRTLDAGGPGTSACHQYDGDPATCQQAFHHTDCDKATSCFYDFGSDECRGCGPNNEADGSCINTCIAGPVTCTNDPSRTLFAGMPQSSACQGLALSVGTASCEMAFHLGAGGIASCYLDGDDCRGCGPSNEADGNCVNTCVHGTPTCDEDPSRTIYAGGPGTSACTQFDGDQAACESAFHTGMCGHVASCFWDPDFNTCNGCGPNNEADAACTNTCGHQPCDGDPSRTIFAGGPGTSACHFFDGNQTLCEKAYHIGSSIGPASCYYDGDTDECRGCGPSNQADGQCVNTCPLCNADPSRTVFAGGPGTSACQQYAGDQAACESAFHYDSCGQPTSCYYDVNFGDCNGCGANNIASNNCSNTCVSGPPTCEKDSSRTLFAGGPNTAACSQYDGDPVSCLHAFHRGASGIASCYYDVGSDDCLGCGPDNENDQSCINTCLRGAPPCAEDPARTTLAGPPNTAACHVFDGNPAGCAGAYHLDSCYNPASCFYDGDSNECMGCGPNNEQNGACTNTCRSGPASCDLDPSRVLFGGGPQTSACDQYLTPATCLAAFHIGQCGPASCYWDGSCRGCGPNNELNGSCFNTCEAP